MLLTLRKRGISMANEYDKIEKNEPTEDRFAYEEPHISRANVEREHMEETAAEVAFLQVFH